MINEVDAAAHVADVESEPTKRAFTRAELQALFDYADEQVAAKRRAGRKGWLSAFRDATMFKVAYSYGLRRNENRMLDVADFGRNPSGAGVRRLRRGLRPLRQGAARIASETAQRADRVAVGDRSAPAMVR